MFCEQVSLGKAYGTLHLNAGYVRALPPTVTVYGIVMMCRGFQSGAQACGRTARKSVAVRNSRQRSHAYRCRPTGNKRFKPHKDLAYVTEARLTLTAATTDAAARPRLRPRAPS
jgi:hypothetical protein